MPLYIFNPTIFSALNGTPAGKGGAMQVTDAVQKLIDSGCIVQPIKLREDDIQLDSASHRLV